MCVDSGVVVGCCVLCARGQARWADFYVQEVRLRDRSRVCITDAVHVPLRPWPLRDELDQIDLSFHVLAPVVGRDAASKLVHFAYKVFERFTSSDTIKADSPTKAGDSPAKASGWGESEGVRARVGGSDIKIKPLHVHIGSRDPEAIKAVCLPYYPFLHFQFQAKGGKGGGTQCC